jgi:hypothetical protein
MTTACSGVANIRLAFSGRESRRADLRTALQPGGASRAHLVVDVEAVLGEPPEEVDQIRGHHVS